MIIRRYTETDYCSLQRVIEASIETTVKETLGGSIAEAIKKYYSKDRINNMEQILLAQNCDDIVGCIAIEKENHAKMLYVIPSYQGVKAAIELCINLGLEVKNRGYYNVELEAIASSRNFMTKIGGIERKKELVNFFGADIELYHMIIPIDRLTSEIDFKTYAAAVKQ